MLAPCLPEVGQMQSVQCFTVVIINDEQSSQDYLASFFAKQHYTVVCADSSREGLRLVYQLQPALVILNFSLAEEDG